MAPPHTRVCGWQRTSRQAFLYFVAELGAAGSSFFPARCDDTTGNHPNHFLLGFRAHALSSHTLIYMEEHNDFFRGAGQGKTGQEGRQGR